MAEFPEDLSDINRDLVDGDFLLVGKFKAALSRVLTYTRAGLFGAAEIGVALTDLDHLIGYDESTSNGQRKILMTRIYDYILAKVPIAVGSWTPTYSAETNLTSTTDVASFYIRVGSRCAFSSRFTTTRNSATVGKNFVMTSPSFITNNYPSTNAVGGVGVYATASDVTATNVVCDSVSSATTLKVSIYDTASSGARTFVVVGIGVVP